MPGILDRIQPGPLCQFHQEAQYVRVRVFTLPADQVSARGKSSAPRSESEDTVAANLERLVLKFTTMQSPEHLLPDNPDQPVILIAEDEVTIQNIARITLEREGYFVLTAENGEVAMLLSQQYPGKIHLLLADI